MKNYDIVKAELKKQAGNTRYFNKTFWRAYQTAIKAIEKNIEKGIDDCYLDGEIWTRHAYDEVRKTRFYTDNGSAYCIFLEIMA